MPPTIPRKKKAPPVQPKPGGPAFEQSLLRHIKWAYARHYNPEAPNPLEWELIVEGVLNCLKEKGIETGQ